MFLYRLHGPINQCCRILLAILFILDDSKASRRIWQGNVARFELADTWKNQRIPCSGDSIELQENRAILVSQHHTLSGLTFASNAVLIMAEGSSLQIIDPRSPARLESLHQCTDRKVSAGPLIADVKANSWFDWENWISVSKTGQAAAKFYLDSERIPCNGDDVEVPTGQTFQIDMPSTLKEPIRLQSFKVGQLLFSNEKLAEYFSKPQGPVLFDQRSLGNKKSLIMDNTSGRTGTFLEDEEPSKAAIFLTIGQKSLNSVEWPCDLTYGCKCANDRKEVMDELCKYVVMAKSAPCQDAISVAGLCHAICGSVVSIQAKDLHRLIDTAKHLQSALDTLKETQPQFLQNVEDDISITYDNTIQVLFIASWDGADGDKEQSALPSHRVAANNFLAELNKDEYKAWIVSQSLLIRWSGDATTSQDHSHHKYIIDGSSSSSATIAGISIGSLLLLILLIAGLWIVWHRRRQLPFSFVRHFGHQEEPLEMDSGTNFFNPLYKPTSDSWMPEDAADFKMEDDRDVIQDSFRHFNDDDKAALAENEF